MSDKKSETGTLRVQFSGPEVSGLKFEDTEPVLELAKKLGISTIYTSPLTAPAPGSQHGYNVIDFNDINPEIGGMNGLERFVENLQRLGLMLMVDYVPNHMSASPHNKYWEDVLTWGQSSEYNKYFEIDWSKQEGRVLLPFLGADLVDLIYDPANAEEDKYHINLHFDTETGKFLLHYYEHYLPLSPETWIDLFEKTAPESGDDPVFKRFKAELHCIKTLPDIREKQRYARSFSKKIKESYAKSHACQKRINDLLSHFNSKEGRKDFDDIANRQPYKLAFWKEGIEGINYRRFFNINELVGLDQRNIEVFEETHKMLFELVRKGYINALRIDHPDGLADPKEYLARLREKLREIFPRETHGDKAERFRIVVEKILEGEEKLRPDWQVQGTVGYEYLVMLNGLYANPSAEEPFNEFYKSFTNDTRDFHTVVEQSKSDVMEVKLSSEINYLSESAANIADMMRRDIAEPSLLSAIKSILKNTDVYRVYMDHNGVSAEDISIINEACAKARKDPLADEGVVDFVRSLLLKDFDVNSPKFRATGEEITGEVDHFIRRFNQVSGPVAAVGVENTAFYRYIRNSALNEVGGNPGKFASKTDEFHAHNQYAQKHHPFGMTSTQTHDTKRGPLTRLLINSITNEPEKWTSIVSHWHEDIKKVTESMDAEMPAPQDELLIYQTLVGALPVEVCHNDPFNTGITNAVNRVKDYVVKAIREASLHTTWTDQDLAYEKTCTDFIDRLFRETEDNKFLFEALELQHHLVSSAALNLAGQTLLKVTSPGIPDTYQGEWLPHFAQSLVDPDNRRRVGPEVYQQMIKQLEEWEREPPDPETLHISDQGFKGLTTFYILWKSMQARAENPDLFTTGKYKPLKASGEYGEDFVAYQRSDDAGNVAVTVSPRLTGKKAACVDNKTLSITGLFNQHAKAELGVNLPEGTVLVNRMDGKEHKVTTNEDGKTVLELPAVFATCPQALLTGKVEPELSPEI
jgi:(1->4)-alpha-D-glucan 1-alpha-D-glucosylmutase